MSKEFNLGDWWTKRQDKKKKPITDRPPPPGIFKPSKDSITTISNETEVNLNGFKFIHSLQYKIIWIDSVIKDDTDIISYTLLERGKIRKVIIAESGLAKTNKYGVKSDMYSTIVIPWLYGGVLKELKERYYKLKEKK